MVFFVYFTCLHYISTFTIMRMVQVSRLNCIANSLLNTMFNFIICKFYCNLAILFALCRVSVNQRYNKVCSSCYLELHHIYQWLRYAPVWTWRGKTVFESSQLHQYNQYCHLQKLVWRHSARPVLATRHGWWVSHINCTPLM